MILNQFLFFNNDFKSYRIISDYIKQCYRQWNQQRFSASSEHDLLKKLLPQRSIAFKGDLNWKINR